MNNLHCISRIVSAIIVAVLMHGCATTVDFRGGGDAKKLRTQLYQLEDFKLTGKLGFRNSDEAFSVAVNDWTQAADHFQIDLSSTFFGLGAVRLSGTAAWIKVEEAGEEPIESYHPNETLEQLLGAALPIQRIRYWIRGVPAPQSSASEEKNELGLVKSMTQDGWTIDLDRYQDINGLPLPGRIKILRADTRITLAVASWSIN